MKVENGEIELKETKIMDRERPSQNKPLFQLGDFTLHSGDKSEFKINCDVLTDKDWKSLAYLISRRCEFKDVWGIPEGGLKLRDYLSFYCIQDESLPILIVDDVLTTGKSMEEARKHIKGKSIGYVVFARGKCPDWITTIFQMWPWSSKPLHDKEINKKNQSKGQLYRLKKDIQEHNEHLQDKKD